MHAQVVKANAPLIAPEKKETEFLLWPNVTRHNIHTSLHHYMRLLNHPCRTRPPALLLKCFHATPAVTMDKTPNYLLDPKVPQLLHTFSPATKVVFMFRDPVERTESLCDHLYRQGRWLETAPTLTAKVTSFLKRAQQQGGSLAERLTAIRNCSDARCTLDAWTKLWQLVHASQPPAQRNFLRLNEDALYVSSLYPYALTVWHHLFERADQFMIIDSHLYYANRTHVMAEVMPFLFGRNITHTELAHARDAPAKNVHRQHAGVRARRGDRALLRGSGPLCVLSEEARRQLREFYRLHFNGSFAGFAARMRDAGAVVVGFTADQAW